MGFVQLKRQTGQLRLTGGIRALGQMGHEPFGKVLLARLQEIKGRAQHRSTREVCAGPIGIDLGPDQGGVHRNARALCRELPVIGRLMLCRAAIGGQRGVLIPCGLLRAGLPIEGARGADRGGHRRLDILEMGQGTGRIVQLAQGDEPRQPFQIGIGCARGHEMVRRQIIGRLCLIIAQQPAGKDRAPPPPARGTAQCLGTGAAFLHEGHRAVPTVLLDAPVEPLPRQTAVVLQGGRDRLNQRVDTGALFAQLMARDGKGADIIRHQIEHQIDGSGRPLPQHFVHPRDMVIGQNGAEPVHQEPVARGIQRQADPCQDRLCLGRVVLTAGQQSLHQAHRAISGFGRRAVEQGQHRRGRGIGAQCALGPHPHAVHARPIAIAPDEIEVFRQIPHTRAKGPPCDDVLNDLILSGRQRPRRIPVIGTHGFHDVHQQRTILRHGRLNGQKHT